MSLKISRLLCLSVHMSVYVIIGFDLGFNLLLSRLRVLELVDFAFIQNIVV